MSVAGPQGGGRSVPGSWVTPDRPDRTWPAPRGEMAARHPHGHGLRRAAPGTACRRPQAPERTATRRWQAPEFAK